MHGRFGHAPFSRTPLRTETPYASMAPLIVGRLGRVPTLGLLGPRVLRGLPVSLEQPVAQVPLGARVLPVLRAVQLGQRGRPEPARLIFPNFWIFSRLSAEQR